MIKSELRYKFRGSLPKNTQSFPSFNLRYGENELGKAQIAVVVSKKVDKRATTRNKIKRQVLEILRNNLDPKTPKTLVFYIKKQVVEAGNLELEIETALNKI